MLGRVGGGGSSRSGEAEGKGIEDGVWVTEGLTLLLNEISEKVAEVKMETARFGVGGELDVLSAGFLR